MNSPSEYNNQFYDYGYMKPQMNQIKDKSHPEIYHQLPYNAQDLNPAFSNMASNIHVNPLICGPRHIYVNKALCFNNPCTNVNQTSTLQSKSERVYYNPKFFKNSNVFNTSSLKHHKIINKDVPKKHENNIYLNPHFIKKENFLVAVPNPVTQNEVQTSSPSVPKVSNFGNGIHFNPKFLDNIFSVKTDINLSHKQISNETVDYGSANIPRHISKYKLIRKKPFSPLKSNLSYLNKVGVRKSYLSFGKKFKLKSTREKYLSYNNKYNYFNKYSYKKISNYKIAFNSEKKVVMKCVLNQQKTVTRFAYENKLIKINQKKSILQQKIEARRKGKSSFCIYGFRNHLPNSKYKYRRVSDSLKFIDNSPKSHYNKHHYHKADKKIVNNASKGDKSVYKTISKTKLVRKSILQAQIQARHFAKKSLLQLQRIPPKHEGQISKYKIVHHSSSSKKNSLSNKKVPVLKKNPMTYSSNQYRIDKLKRLHILTKKLRKNNQLCSFYNKYGRCKGKEKGSCPKVHDSKYVSICKKFLKGECKDKVCTLSHDIRPEKMPTCHHYLSGLCTRTNCPYLHIKVNKKAPICRAFLQGFCADVFNCNKRHEFICPMFAEKGHCIKGKSCSLPHRTPKTYSKLLEPDQFPLLNFKSQKRNKTPEVSKKDKVTMSRENVSGKNNRKVNKQKEIKQFQRYFLASLPIKDGSVIETENETVNKIST